MAGKGLGQICHSTGEAPQCVKCLKSFTNPKETQFTQQRVRSRQETVNNQLQFWGVLKQTYRHDTAEHGDVLRSCACLTQIAVDNGEPLFSCGYKDPPVNNPYEVPDQDDDDDL